MKKLIRLSTTLVICGFLVSCSASKKTDISIEASEGHIGITSFMAGGRVLQADEAPFAVRILDANLNHRCTGTLISPTRVITAAHCFNSGEIKYVSQYIGYGLDDDRRQEIAIQAIDASTNMGYIVSRSTSNDYAFIDLAEEIVLEQYPSFPAPASLQKCKLKNSINVDLEVCDGVDLIQVGTGFDENSRLGVLKAQAHSFYKKDDEIGSLITTMPSLSSRPGDSGGGFFIRDRDGNYYLIGITSEADSLPVNGVYRTIFAPTDNLQRWIDSEKYRLVANSKRNNGDILEANELYEAAAEEDPSNMGVYYSWIVLDRKTENFGHMKDLGQRYLGYSKLSPMIDLYADYKMERWPWEKKKYDSILESLMRDLGLSFSEVYWLLKITGNEPLLHSSYCHPTSLYYLALTLAGLDNNTYEIRLYIEKELQCSEVVE